MTPKQLEEYYRLIAKQGKAEFKIVFKAAPGDDDFRSADPLAEVTVTATHPETGAQIPPQTRQMSSTENEAPITIPILSVSNGLKQTWDKLWGKPKPKPSKVVITVRPHKDWEGLYEEKSFPVDAAVGRNPPIHVWMTPKKRFDGLAKPKGPPVSSPGQDGKP
jgi:hypothetical protein